MKTVILAATGLVLRAALTAGFAATLFWFTVPEASREDFRALVYDAAFQAGVRAGHAATWAKDNPQVFFPVGAAVGVLLGRRLVRRKTKDDDRTEEHPTTDTDTPDLEKAQKAYQDGVVHFLNLPVVKVNEADFTRNTSAVSFKAVPEDESPAVRRAKDALVLKQLVQDESALVVRDQDLSHQLVAAEKEVAWEEKATSDLKDALAAREAKLTRCREDLGHVTRSKDEVARKLAETRSEIARLKGKLA